MSPACQDLAQRDAALALANCVRITNAKTIRGIRKASRDEGRERVAEILLDADEKGPIGSLSIGRLLAAPHGMGDAAASVILRRAGAISPEKRLRQLTMRQRRAIAGQLTGSLVWAVVS